MVKRKSLGRGLDVLLGSDVRRIGESDADSELKQIPVDLLVRGKYQPRLDMRSESLAELAESIRAQGMVQPIVVRPLGGSDAEQRYEIIAGERRWRAAQVAGLHQVPAIVRDIPDRAAVAVALIENIQREGLNPLEEAGALRRLVEEFEMTHAEAAEAVGRSRAAVTNLLRLLELGEPIRAMLERREIDMGHARALLALERLEDQLAVAKRVVREGLSVRATEQAVKRALSADGGSRGAGGRPAAGQKDPDVRRLELRLGEKLGAPVEVQQSGRGGRVVIRYHTLDELQGIIEKLGAES